jgi:hypothetical protein
MRKNKVLSNLSMAAIALVAAAFPCFAQTQSNDARGESAGISAADESGLMLAFNRTPTVSGPRVNASFVQPKGALEIAPVKTASTFSAADFKTFSQSSGQFTRENRLFNTQVSVYEAATFNFRPQFNVDNYVPSERPRVTFVPSRRPWLPSPMPNPN